MTGPTCPRELQRGQPRARRRALSAGRGGGGGGESGVVKDRPTRTNKMAIDGETPRAKRNTADSRDCQTMPDLSDDESNAELIDESSAESTV